MALRRLSSRRFRTAKGKAGFVTRQVSSRNTRPGCKGMPYRKEGTSSCAPHTPSPAAGCSKSCNLRNVSNSYAEQVSWLRNSKTHLVHVQRFSAAALLPMHICDCSSCINDDSAQAACTSVFNLLNGRPLGLSSMCACCGGWQVPTCEQCQARGRCGGA